MRTIQCLLAGLVLACAFAATAADLVEPGPVDIPGALTQADVVKAIKNAIIRDKWAVEKEEPGHIVATFSPGPHVAKVNIAYTDKQVLVTYLDSSNLDYSEHDGHREIHRNYNKWVQHLANDIALFDVGDMPQSVRYPGATNAAPSEKLSAFSHFEIVRITMDAPYAGQDNNERAADKIQDTMQSLLNPDFGRWNTDAPAGKPRALRIEPHIESITFIDGGARFFVGALAGSSDVVLTVKYVDADTGQVIAAPHFHAHSAARRGFMGISDNEMLNRVAALVQSYTENNYAEAVGGAAGDPQ